MRKRSRSTPWAALGLLLALLWCALGAPLTQSEWEAVPSRVRRSWRQLPVQFARVFSLWHTPQTAAMAQEEELLLRVYDTEAGPFACCRWKATWWAWWQPRCQHPGRRRRFSARR